MRSRLASHRRRQQLHEGAQSWKQNVGGHNEDAVVNHARISQLACYLVRLSEQAAALNPAILAKSTALLLHELSALHALNE